MIDVSHWKSFLLLDVFEYFETGKVTQAGLLEEGDDIWYLGAKKDCNGLMNKVAMNENLLSKGNCVVFICDGQGSVGYANYMDKEFLGTVNLTLGYGKNINKFTGLFIATVASLERYRYSYGRKWRGKVEKTVIKLPVDKEGNPNWQYMEDYIKTTSANIPTTKNNISSNIFDTSMWEKFSIEELFNIKKGKRLTSEQQTDGSTPYIGAIDSNNGVSNYIGQEPIHEGNTISLSYNGSVGEAFYQENPFWATDDVNVLYPKFKMNKYIALFICAILKKEKYRFSYGRKWTLDQMKKSKIRLPAISKGYPDWQFMEDYIKSLPYGDCI